MYIVYCTMFNVQCTLDTVQCILLYNVQVLYGSNYGCTVANIRALDNGEHS